jgi:hypothetical protein
MAEALRQSQEKSRTAHRRRDSEGEWEMIGYTISHSLPRSAWAIRAAAAMVGSFPLLAVVVYVADEYPAFESTARALAITEATYLEARRRRDL